MADLAWIRSPTDQWVNSGQLTAASRETIIANIQIAIHDSIIMVHLKPVVVTCISSYVLLLRLSLHNEIRIAGLINLFRLNKVKIREWRAGAMMTNSMIIIERGILLNRLFQFGIPLFFGQLTPSIPRICSCIGLSVAGHQD